MVAGQATAIAGPAWGRRRCGCRVLACVDRAPGSRRSIAFRPAPADVMTWTRRGVGSMMAPGAAAPARRARAMMGRRLLGRYGRRLHCVSAAQLRDAGQMARKVVCLSRPRAAGRPPLRAAGPAEVGPAARGEPGTRKPTEPRTLWPASPHRLWLAGRRLLWLAVPCRLWPAELRLLQLAERPPLCLAGSRPSWLAELCSAWPAGSRSARGPSRGRRGRARCVRRWGSGCRRQRAGGTEPGQLRGVAGGQAVCAGLRELRLGPRPRIPPPLPRGRGSGQAGVPVDLPGQRGRAGIWCVQREVGSWHGPPPPGRRCPSIQTRTHPHVQRHDSK